MAKQKRLNKNLVAFLTVMGVIIIIAVFTLIVYQGSRRDPEVLAESARASRAANDLDEARRRFLRAYEASEQRGKPNTQYVIDAAGCLFEMGELPSWYGLLEKISAKVPNDPSLIIAQLEGHWHIRGIVGFVLNPSLWRDASEKLLKLDKESLLAKTSLAQGLWQLGGPENEQPADELAQQAFAQAPTDPRVVLTYIIYLQRQMSADISAAQTAGRPISERQAISKKILADAIAVLEAALAEHPGDVPLVVAYRDVVLNAANALAQLGEANQAAELRERVGACIARAVELNATQPSPELLLARARYELERFDLAHPNLTPADIPALRGELDVIEQHAREATALDPALFDGYTLQAELKRFALGPNGEELSVSERLDKTLAIYEAARERTLTLRNLRAQLRQEDRLFMLRRAFDLAMALETLDASGRGTPATYARADVLLQDARVKWPEHAVTYYMQGQMLIGKGDLIGATTALERAYEKAEQDPRVMKANQAAFWLRFVRVNRLPVDQLAVLYARRDQFGEAAKYAQLAMDQFRAADLVPSSQLVGLHAEMLRQTGEAPKALAVLNDYSTVYPDDQALAAVRVKVLTDLGRADEAKALMGKMSDTGVSARLWRAQQAAEQGDVVEAERVLREMLADDAATDEQVHDALQSLIALLDDHGRRPEARQLVDELIKDPPRGGMQRQLQAYKIELEPDDPRALTPQQQAELDQKRLALIDDMPEGLPRIQVHYQFYRARGEWEKALEYLVQLREQLPGEVRIVQEEFAVRLQLKQFDQLGPLVTLLSQYNDGQGFDGAGGATYRGDVALAKGDAALAVREYRQAIQVLPKTGELQIKLAKAYLTPARPGEEPRTDEGLEALRKAVEINPRSFEGYGLLADVYNQLAKTSFGAEKAENERRFEEARQKAAALNPNHPVVKAWEQEAAEERDPLAAIATREARRAASPDDPANLLRMAELYVRAWRQSADTDEAARQQLAERGAAFFAAVVPAASGDVQAGLARQAAEFYQLTKRTDEGAALLRGVVETSSGARKVHAQLLVGMFYESLGNADAAEREYLVAQRMVREVTEDVETRRNLDLSVGLGMARFYDRLRRLDKVVETCRWLLDRIGGEAAQAAVARQVRLTLLQTLFNAGQLGDAEAEIAEFLRLYPDDLEALSIRAQVRLRKHEPSAALEDLNEILKRAPDDVMALHSRGRLLLDQGRYDKAQEDLVRAAEHVARKPQMEYDVRVHLASLYVRTQQYDRAAEQLRMLLESLGAQGGRAEQKQAVVGQLARLLYGAMDQFDRAARLISEYMERYPQEPLWPFELGRLYETQGDKAEREAKTAAARNESSRERERRDAARQSYVTAAGYYRRAAERAAAVQVGERAGATIAQIGALTKAGRGAEGVKLYEQFRFDELPPAAQMVARARMASQAARALVAINQPDEARQKWLAALRDAGQQDIALAGDLANSLRDTYAAQPGASEAILREAVEQNAADPAISERLRIVLATYLCLNGNPAGALPLLADALTRVQPGSPEHLSALLTQAQAQETSGDTSAAVATYRQVLERYAENITALNNLAYLLVTAEPPNFAPAEAKKYAERLKDLVAGNANAATMLDTIGWVYFKNNDLEAAIAALQDGIESGGGGPAIYFHLAEAYGQAKRDADRREILRRGLEEARERDDTEEVRKFEAELEKN